MILTGSRIREAEKRLTARYELALKDNALDAAHAALVAGVKLYKLLTQYAMICTVSIHFPEGDQQMTLLEADALLAAYPDLMQDFRPKASSTDLLARYNAVQAAVNVGMENKLDTDAFELYVDPSLFD